MQLTFDHWNDQKDQSFAFMDNISGPLIIFKCLPLQTSEFLYLKLPDSTINCLVHIFHWGNMLQVMSLLLKCILYLSKSLSKS